MPSVRVQFRVSRFARTHLPDRDCGSSYIGKQYEYAAREQVLRTRRVRGQVAFVLERRFGIIAPTVDRDRNKKHQQSVRQESLSVSVNGTNAICRDDMHVVVDVNTKWSEYFLQHLFQVVSW